MNRIRLLLPLLLLSLHAKAEKDSSLVAIPDITYRALDSVIRTSAYTGIFFWSGWCGGCAQHFPELLDAARSEESITFYSVNDPDTRPFAPKARFNHSHVLKGYYRIQRHGKKAAISINDFTQQRYFLNYYTGITDRKVLRQTLSFLLFDKTGKIIYSSKENITADRLKAVLAGYSRRVDDGPIQPRY